MNQRGFAGGAQLFQVPVAELALFVLLVADRLRIRDSLGNGRGCVGIQLAGCRVSSCHSWKRILGMTNEHCQYVDEDRLFSRRMFQTLIGKVWRSLPARFRRWAMRATHPRF